MFYKLKFHSLDFYKEFFDEKEQPNMKAYLENVLFTIIKKAEKERYLSEIFYAVLDGDNQDFEIILAYPEMIKPGEDLIYALMDNLNAFADDELMSRLVEPSEFVIETISSYEFFGKMSHHKTRLISVTLEFENAAHEESWPWADKYKELIKEHPELEEE